jgi:hypothetical protein
MFRYARRILKICGGVVRLFCKLDPLHFRIATPFSVARLVMERSPHSFLVGDGAQQFAKEHGIPVVSNELLQSEGSTKAYKVFAKTLPSFPVKNQGLNLDLKPLIFDYICLYRNF